MTGERQIELTWRCSSCGQRNLGRHVACQGCGSPKDESEQYEMPGDPGAAATVTDPRLLAMARAGENWRCRYCGSDQRTLAGTCAQCGASQAEGTSTALARGAARMASTDRRSRGIGLKVAALGGALSVLFALGLCAMTSARRASPAHARLEPGTRSLALPFAEEVVTVSGVSWSHEVIVERWQVLRREGFGEQKPAEAFDVRPAGERHHHDEQVQDGFDTQTYTETVPDGFRTESYTEQESCGQDCTPRPQTCSEKCTSNQNGFATCKTVCTGGGQDCRPRTCTVQKTRQVPQTKTVQRTRQVPRFKTVARSAPFFTWKIWGWQTARRLTKRGTTAETSWPSPDEIELGRRLAPGEKERESRIKLYSVELATSAGARIIPLATAEELGAWVPGSRKRARVWKNGRVDML